MPRRRSAVPPRPKDVPLRQYVANSVRWMINAGELMPGDHIAEEVLAAELRVSRNPVREGLRTLEAMGLIVVEPYKGARVASLTPARAVALLEVRSLVESHAAAEAAIHRTDDDLARLHDIYARGERALAKRCLADVAQLHSEFHLAIDRAADNVYLSFVMEPLSAQTELLQSLGRGTLGEMNWREHGDILGAIEDRDPELARKLAAHHLANILTSMRELAASEASGR